MMGDKTMSDIVVPRYSTGQLVQLNGYDGVSEIKEFKNIEGKPYYRFSNDEEWYPENKLTYPKPKWEWSSLKESYKQKPPLSYLVQDIFILPSLNILYGEPGSLKTMLMMDLAICVAGGKEWLSGLPEQNISGYSCQQNSVLWIDLDNGKDLIERRFKAIGHGHGILEDSPINYVSFPPFALNDSDSVQELLNAIRYFEAKLIVFDNLGTISGGTDENSSQMISVMGKLRKMAEQTNSAVVVIHHTSKAGSLRGHTSINAAVDFALLTKRNGDTVSMESTKTRHASIDPFLANWSYTPDGKELVKARFYGQGEFQGDRQDSKVDRAENQIMLDLKDGMNQSEIVELMKKKDIGRDTTLAALKKLTAEKKLEKRDTGRKNSIAYYRV